MKTLIYQEFIIKKKPPIYKPDDFKVFCQQAGANSLFNTILSSVTSPRHSYNRIQTNKLRTVGLIYNMCYCLSQQCNKMQVDKALYLQTSHANQEAIMTEHQLGNTCCRRLVNNIQTTLCNTHKAALQSFFEEAISKEWLLVLVIDDYTTVHTVRRPTKSKFSQGNTMCTIIVKAFKQLSAVKRPADITNLHYPNGINIPAITMMITSPCEMSKLAHSYASIMPNWMTDHFVNPDMELHLQRLRTHEYCESNSARQMRKMDNVHLVDFIELELKGKEIISRSQVEKRTHLF